MQRNVKIALARKEDLDSIHEILVQRCNWFLDNHIDQWKINWYPKKYDNTYFLKQMQENFLYVAKEKKELIGVMLLKTSDEVDWKGVNNS